MFDPNQQFMPGIILVTSNIEVVKDADLRKMKILNMDEDGILENRFLNATLLLPPIEAKIAEVDGDEAKYDEIYAQYLTQPAQLLFIGALLTVLRRGGYLLAFIPDLDHNNTVSKFIEHMSVQFGVHPGLIGSNDPFESQCLYDTSFLPLWLDMIYLLDANPMSAEEYLTLSPIPVNQIQNTDVLYKLLDELNPPEDTINKMMEALERFRQNSKMVPNLRIPFRKTGDAGMQSYCRQMYASLTGRVK